MKLIVGLGNPGQEYAKTRHNVGFMILNKMRVAFDFPEFELKTKLSGEVSKGMLNKTATVFLKPSTFMNQSGLSVSAVMSFFKITPPNILIIHDEKDIPLGETRVQTDRGSAGHNGVLSIIESLGTKDFSRIRVGIAPEGPVHDTANFVLHPFSKEEFSTLTSVFDSVENEVREFIKK